MKKQKLTFDIIPLLFPMSVLFQSICNNLDPLIPILKCKREIKFKLDRCGIFPIRNKSKVTFI